MNLPDIFQNWINHESLFWTEYLPATILFWKNFEEIGIGQQGIFNYIYTGGQRTSFQDIGYLHELLVKTPNTLP